MDPVLNLTYAALPWFGVLIIVGAFLVLRSACRLLWMAGRVPSFVRQKVEPLALYGLAREVSRTWDSGSHPSALLRHDAFLRGVAHLRDGIRIASDDLVAFARGDNWVIACMSLDGLRQRADRRPADYSVPVL